MHLEIVFDVMVALVALAIIIAPIGLGIAILVRLARKPSKSVSVEQIAQLEQNDSIIVEDINEALSAIAGRLEAIEERLDREEQTVKGFASKKNQLND